MVGRPARVWAGLLLPGPAIPPLDRGLDRRLDVGVGEVVADCPGVCRRAGGDGRQVAAARADRPGAGHLLPGPAIPPLDQGLVDRSGAHVPRRPGPGIAYSGHRVQGAAVTASGVRAGHNLPHAAIPPLDQRPERGAEVGANRPGAGLASSRDAIQSAAGVRATRAGTGYLHPAAAIPPLDQSLDRFAGAEIPDRPGTR